jgi:hypothetical protein
VHFFLGPLVSVFLGKERLSVPADAASYATSVGSWSFIVHILRGQVALLGFIYHRSIHLFSFWLGALLGNL